MNRLRFKTQGRDLMSRVRGGKCKNFGGMMAEKDDVIKVVLGVNEDELFFSFLYGHKHILRKFQ